MYNIIGLSTRNGASRGPVRLPDTFDTTNCGCSGLRKSVFANKSTIERKTVAEAVAEELRMRILAASSARANNCVRKFWPPNWASAAFRCARPFAFWRAKA